ncbi:hypothetical protein EW146_g9005 [Bondarzewia mesenterica]|uniref:ATP synthase subunit 4 n=1 Tax=Bondarzewia mesenterica TaxID=1095465 RepID=A0A4S4LA72_9AGAM|nr:hypothetical protein EW146_g9005 [Bondarzewia mesenterica]
MKNLVVFDAEWIKTSIQQYFRGLPKAKYVLDGKTPYYQDRCADPEAFETSNAGSTSAGRKRHVEQSENPESDCQPHKKPRFYDQNRQNRHSLDPVEEPIRQDIQWPQNEGRRLSGDTTLVSLDPSDTTLVSLETADKSATAESPVKHVLLDHLGEPIKHLDICQERSRLVKTGKISRSRSRSTVFSRKVVTHPNGGSRSPDTASPSSDTLSTPSSAKEPTFMECMYDPVVASDTGPFRFSAAAVLAGGGLKELFRPASRVRPQAVAAVSQLMHARAMSTPPPPAERASEVINKLPSSPNLITKTGSAILGSGLIAAAISQELYVMNEETVVAVGYLILFTYIAKIIRTPYKEWAEGHINRIKSVLDKSRTEHTQAVKDRIESVNQMKDVVSLTQGLFAVSKETATLESDIFVQRQRVALASEVKAVLDSWVRYEQQEKEQEQAQLVKTVVDNVLKNLQDDKTQREVLAWAVSEVEQLVKSKAI